jgi:hypothetical protein
MMAAAITLEICTPAWIFALTRVGATLATDCHTREA